MTPEELSKFRRRTTPKLNSFIPVRPTKQQTVFLLLDDVLEVLFGGAAGGGKSEALLMAATQYVDVPGYSAILFRKTFRDLALPGALMDRSKKWWDNSKAKWSSSDYNWTFPSGAKIQFGYLEHEGDEHRYQSAEFQAIFFDELTQFSEQSFTYMFSRLRRTKQNIHVPLRMRAACVDEGDVLTEHGWKPIENVMVGEMVYSTSVNGTMTLKPVLEFYKTWVDEPMVRVDKKNLHMSMTTDHRVVLRSVGSSEYRITPWNEHLGRSIDVARAPISFDSPGCDKTDDELAFLGLFLAEGSTCTPRKGNYKVLVTQCNLSGQEKIHELMKRMPYRYCLSKNGDFQITNKALWEELRPLGKAHEKYVPRDVIEFADARQLRILFDWMVFGDGHIRGSAITYITSSAQLSDDVCEIGVKLGYKVMVKRKRLPGYPTHNDRYEISLLMSKQAVTRIDKNDVRNDVAIDNFQGNVFCIKVADNANFVIRQKGTVWLSGNTNPGGKGHEWVKKRFNLPSGRVIEEGASRAFVRSLIDDNPYLDIEMYERSLEELSPITRAQLRSGDWTAANSGGKFRREWFTTIDKADIPDRQYWQRVVRHWDLATQEKTEHVPDPDWTAGCSMLRVGALPPSIRDWMMETGQVAPPPPYWIVLHVARFRKNAGDVEEAVAGLSANDGHHRPVSIEQERGASGAGIVAAYRRHVLPHTRTVIPVWAKGTKEERAAVAAGYAKEGRVFLVEGEWNEPFLDELSIFGIPDVHDDQVDAFSGAFKALDKLDYVEDQPQAAQH